MFVAIDVCDPKTPVGWGEFPPRSNCRRLNELDFYKPAIQNLGVSLRYRKSEVFETLSKRITEGSTCLRGLVVRERLFHS